MRNVLAAVFDSTKNEIPLPKKIKRTKKGSFTRDPVHYRRVEKLLSNLRAQCYQRKEVCDLDLDYLLNELVVPQVCPVLNTALDWSSPNNKAYLDRLDRDKGFVKGNVRWISARALKIKGDANLTEIEAVARYMRGSNAYSQ